MAATAVLAAYAVPYLLRVRSLARRGRPVPRRRVACFLSGLAVLALAVAPSVDRSAEQSMAVHMAEHLVIADLASLLLVLGLTGPVLAPLLRLRWVERLRVFAHPAPALLLWAANLWLWHLPVAYDGALRHDAVHVIQHICFLVFGMNLWMPLFGPFPKPAWFGGAAQLAYVTLARVCAAALANVFVWSGTAFYDSYPDLGDQSAAGAVMMVEESVALVALTGWLLLRWIRDAGERQELAELAGKRGVTVDERRIARAVASGNGRELRRRLDPRSG